MGLSALSRQNMQLFNREIMFMLLKQSGKGKRSKAPEGRHSPLSVTCPRSMSRAWCLFVQRRRCQLSAFNRRLIKCSSLWVRVKWVTADTGYVTYCLPARRVYPISDMLHLSFPSSCTALPTQPERGNRRAGRQRCARTGTARCSGDRLGVT